MTIARIEPRPYCWVLHGDDNATLDGWIDARISEEGEFSKPLYEAREIAELVEERDRLRAMAGDVRWQELSRPGTAFTLIDRQMLGEMYRAARLDPYPEKKGAMKSPVEPDRNAEAIARGEQRAYSTDREEYDAMMKAFAQQELSDKSLFHANS